MALKIYDTLAPQGDYPAVKAESVEMPDGSRLSDFKGGVTSVNGQTGAVTIEIPEAINGADGKDGVSPTVYISEIEGGHSVEITDVNGVQYFDVMDGKDGQGASITVDSALSATSTNPVQNKVITAYFNDAVQTLEQLQASIPTIDISLSKAGYAADAGAVGVAIEQAMQEAGQALDMVMGAIPTETTVYAWIDDYLSEALGGEY